MTTPAREALEEAVRGALDRAYVHGALTMSLKGRAPLRYPESGTETEGVLAALDAGLARERRRRAHLAGERDEARSDFSRLRSALLEGGQSDAAVRKRCLSILAAAGTIPVGASLEVQRAQGREG